MNSPPLLDLSSSNLPQLIHARGLPCHRTLRYLRNPTENILRRERISSGSGLYANDANSGVIRGAVVLAVAKISDPSLEGGAVVLLDEITVGDDGGAASDGGPFAGAVDKGDVDAGVALEVVGLAGLSVGVE